MEQSLSSLIYRGSIPEAIAEAKKQRKLFIVYISGDDAESSCLESSTWTDLKVVEAVSKYCILLHLVEGSNDAAQFSAIFPQKSVPCITAVGYNGIQLWQNEGSISSEVLASSLEKVWLSLHIQDTTAAVLSAALASKTSEPSTSGVSTAAPSDEGSTSAFAQSHLTEKHIQSPDAKINGKLDNAKEERCGQAKVNEFGDTSKLVVAGDVEFGGSRKSNSSPEAGKELQHPATVDLDNAAAGDLQSRTIDGSNFLEKSNYSDSLVLGGGPQLLNSEANQVVEDSKDEVVDDKIVNKLSDVHLNIRMPHGRNLQEKFSVSSTLRIVKEYVDEHQDSVIGSYDLAIPYPRKVYNDQDLSKTLSELGLFDRQALIVVFRQAATGQSNSRSIVESSNESNAGYLSYVKRIFSFINPLSYLGGGSSSTSSGQQSHHGASEYSSNSLARNNFTQAQRPNSASSPSGGNGSKSKQPTTSHFGSNIHTLKRDEDDRQFDDRNSYWNGNSTQFGGNDNGK